MPFESSKIPTAKVECWSSCDWQIRALSTIPRARESPLVLPKFRETSGILGSAGDDVEATVQGRCASGLPNLGAHDLSLLAKFEQPAVAAEFH